VTPAALALMRAQANFVTRMGELAAKLAKGEDVWREYAEAAAALAAIAPQAAPGANGRLMTTSELAEWLNVSAKTVLRKRKRGELQAVQLGARGPGALRWRAQA
jgi:excisionase family DNA binding protein